jgi:hypothetical protein
LVQGNLIGTDASGTVALGNFNGVVASHSNNTIGGTAAGAGNIISGNRNDGVLVMGLGIVIQGNYIGTDVSGSSSVGNAFGVYVTSSNNTIGGTASGAGNLISGNTNVGVFVFGGDSDQVQGNRIGTDASGTLALGNQTGVEVDGGINHLVGGTPAGAGNLISGNRGDGIVIAPLFGPARSHVIQGNYIGTDVTGTLPLSNGGNGVSIAGAGFGGNAIGGTAPGAGNVIAFNGGDGVLIDASTGNAIRRNRIFANGSLGIELLDGANNNQPAPVLTSASSSGGFLTFQGTLTAAPLTTYTLEFFANTTADPSGFGQGERFIGFITVTTDASGHATFAVGFPSDVQPGEFLTATATDPANNTSAFSQDMLISA